MVIKSKGLHRRSRARLSRSIGERGRINIRRTLQAFDSSDRVVIDPDPSVQQNIPNRRFFGISGSVIQRKGKAYTIQIKDGNKKKYIDLLPVHLKRL